MKFTLSLEDAKILLVMLDNPGIKEMYDKLVQCYIDVANCTKAEAQNAVFPDFAKGLISFARANEIVKPRKETDVIGGMGAG